MNRTRGAAAGGAGGAAVQPCLRILLTVLLALALPSALPAQTGEVIYSRQPIFRIPFQTDPNERRIQQVQLFVSTDFGQSWQLYANAQPEQGSFKFTADRDGTYWFSVRTRDFQGQFYPPNMDGLRPGLRVCVDSHPPVVALQALPARDGGVGVSWEVRDDHLDVASLRLEYRTANSVEWQSVPLEAPAATGQKQWFPGGSATLEVRLRARDQADNWGEARLPVTPGAGSGAAPPPPPPPAPTAAATNPAVRMVNSKRISLNYEVNNVGPSGISAVELWYTQDGRNWQKYEERPNPQPPFVVEVNDEGTYGFTLLVKSGVGLAERPPQVGDPPQVWVEVDLTRPVVQVLNVDVGRGSDSGNLTITWRATDKNLGRQPIALFYAEQAGGPWTPIARDLENSGRHVWKMPTQGTPYRFFVKVEAVDRAGNLGAAEWDKPVIVDLALPKVRILNVEGSANR